MLLFANDGELYEVPDSDCELADDDSGFYLLAAEGEDEEDFYVFVDVDADDDADDADADAE